MNPEIQFKRYPPDYSNLNLEEIPFCQVADYQGDLQTYCLDVITSANKAKEPQKVILFIHGGGFTKPSDKRQSYISYFAQELAKEGYTVIAPDYPVFDNEALRDAYGDTKDWCQKPAQVINYATKFVQDNASKLCIDPNKIIIMGGSAGAMVAFYSIEKQPNNYKLFANLWGAPDVMPQLKHFPPTISVHGTADVIVPYENELPVQEMFEQLSIPHKLITLQNAGHTPIPQAMEHLPTMLSFFAQYI